LQIFFFVKLLNLKWQIPFEHIVEAHKDATAKRT